MEKRRLLIVLLVTLNHGTQSCARPNSHIIMQQMAALISPFRVVFGLIPRGPLDLETTPDRTRHHGEAIDFIQDLQDVHKHAQSQLKITSAKYKKAADTKRRELIFQPGDLVWVYLPKERLPLREYNKIKSKKLGPIEVLEGINPNVYRVKLPSHLRTSDVFNIKHLTPFKGDNDPTDLWTNPSQPGGPDAA